MAVAPELRARFDAALQEKNFGARCHQLAAIGKALRAAAPEPGALLAAVEALADLPATAVDATAPASGVGATIHGLEPLADGSLDVWGLVVGEDDKHEKWLLGNGRWAKRESEGAKWAWAPAEEAPSAFCQRACLLVAKAAGCAAFAKKLLGHPSRTVRFEAARGGLLAAGDAREAFLSPAHGRKLKQLLVGCSALPCDKEVLDHAWDLFGGNDTELVWLILVRATDEDLFRSWTLGGGKLQAWLHAERSHLTQVAERFPAAMVDLVKGGVLTWKWYWMKSLLQSSPLLVLQTVFLEGQCSGNGPKRGYNPDADCQELGQTLASWGWRHVPDAMLDICRELASRDSVELAALHLQLVQYLMRITSTRHAITTSKKIDCLCSVWSQLPTKKKTSRQAQTFVELLPQLQENRAADLPKQVDAFWKIVADVGRAGRKELLVGQEASPSCTKTLKSFAKSLPPPLAVEQFFRILEEFDAATPAYQFIQSDICCCSRDKPDGAHDALALRVFERYLQKEGLTSVQATSMFQVLLKDARSRDVVQKAFGLLVQSLRGKMELGLMQGVVQKMHKLERDASDKATAKLTPPAALPVPVHWANLVKLPEGASSHAHFILHVLHSGTAATELLGAMLQKYGPAFFWDCLAFVLQASSARKPAAQLLAEQRPPAVDLELLRRVDLVSLGKPLPEGAPAAGAEAAEGVGAVSVYFEKLEETKRKTLGKDSNARGDGYLELIGLAQKDVDPEKAFADLLPFVVGKLKGEQDGVRLTVLSSLLRAEGLPRELWKGFLQHLQALWKICAKDREADPENIWGSVGSALVEDAIREWEDSDEPSPAGKFGLEVVSTIDGCQYQKTLHHRLVDIFVKLQKGRKENQPLSDRAARWVFTQSLAAGQEGVPPIQHFWQVLERLAQIVPAGKGAERALWEKWAFVSERWMHVLDDSASPLGAEFTFVGVVELLTAIADRVEYKVEDAPLGASRKRNLPWWEPLDSEEYRVAVSAILEQIESQEIPPKEASSMIERRVSALAKKECRNCLGDTRKSCEWKVWARQRCAKKVDDTFELDLKALSWVERFEWDVQKQRRYNPVPHDTYRCRESIADGEVSALSKVLKLAKSQANNHRHVLWQVTQVAAQLSGPKVQALLQDAIADLDPRFEGMARAIGRQYPYMNAVLTKQEEQDGCSDVLTPLLELLLLDDGTRDASVGEIMKRSDCHYFLFFGTSFARHLSNARQEWLHRCLERLREPEELQGEPEFYSYLWRGPRLTDLAQLGTKWRRALACEWTPSVAPAPAKGKGGGKGRGGGKGGGRGKAAGKGSGRGSGKGTGSSGPGERGPPGVQMYLWHSETQALFIRKALHANDNTSLVLASRAEFADGFAVVRRKLQRFPQEQSVKQTGDGFGWQIIQAACAFNDIKAEVERRFLEQPPPWACDAMTDPQADVLMWSMGRCDLEEPALKIIGTFMRSHEAKLKNAKISSTKLMLQASPVKARRLLKDIMLPRKAGVGMQTAGLRLLVDLKIPEPLELYSAAWSKGKCPRDVAGIVLGKINNLQSSSPEQSEQLRGFYTFFKDMADEQEECIYVAGLLLDQLAEVKEWSLPFLPEVVAELAMLPGMTRKALDALKASSSHVSEVVRAVTSLLGSARLAARACLGSSADAAGPEAQTLQELSEVWSFTTLDGLVRSMSAMSLESCDPEVLRGFVDFAMRLFQENAHKDLNQGNSLGLVLALWVKLLRPGQGQEWPQLLSRMEARLVRYGKLRDLGLMSGKVVERTLSLELGAEERGAVLAVVGDFLDRLLLTHLAGKGEPEAEASDEAFRKQDAERRKVETEVLMKHWTGLLAKGCPEREFDRLFGRCPERNRLDLASAVVDAAIKECEREREARGRQRRQPRPRREAGVPVEDVRVGAAVDGTVTSSSAAHGVFFDFGCVVDGKLDCLTADWKKYGVGDVVRGMAVSKVDVKKNEAFIELTLDPSGGARDPSWEVARCAVREVGARPAAVRLYFATFARLWASVAALDGGPAAFARSLALLGAPAELHAAERVLLVEQLLGRKPEKALARQALDWLGRDCPEHAVRLWPALFAESASGGVEPADVEALLTLCGEHSVDPPPLPAVVARGMSDEVMAIFFASRMPEARLVVVQALSERHLTPKEVPPLLTKLGRDPCEVVAVAARKLLATLQPEKASKGGATDDVHDEDDSSSD